MKVGGIFEEGERFGVEVIEVGGLGQGFLPDVSMENAFFKKVAGK